MIIHLQIMYVMKLEEKHGRARPGGCNYIVLRMYFDAQIGLCSDNW